MKSRDFVYWLQGYFELSDVDELEADTVMSIRNHINMVFEYEKTIEFPFAYWMKGVLDTHKGSFDYDLTRQIKDKLHDVFEHQIDPKMGDKKMQDNLGKLHGNSDGVIAKC